MPRSSTALIPTERIERAILLIRGEKVMLDEDLAALYGVPVKRLLQSFKRNRERFPADFAYQLTIKEFTNLRSQIVTSNEGRGGRRYRPFAFTENGVAMLSSVLRSKRAIAVNIEIMRTFTRLRQILAGHADLSRRLDDLASREGKSGITPLLNESDLFGICSASFPEQMMPISRAQTRRGQTETDTVPASDVGSGTCSPCNRKPSIWNSIAS
jgi:hypothetical protein